MFEELVARGQQPGCGNDWFDESLSLEWIEQQIAEAMSRAGVDPAIVYACERTGIMLSAINETSCPPSYVDLWESALAEYEHRSGRPAAQRRITDEDIGRALACCPAPVEGRLRRGGRLRRLWPEG